MKNKLLGILMVSLFAFSLAYLPKKLQGSAEASPVYGHWRLMEVKTLEDRYPGANVLLSLGGEEGAALVGMRQNQHSAQLLWQWNKPPRILVPGIQWKSKITGSIQEWTLSRELSSTLGMRFQSYQASCCDPLGVDMGMLNLSLERDEPVEKTKTLMEYGTIPRWGDLDSAKSMKIQLLVNIVQQGGSFQWIYVYEYVRTPPLIEIRLKLGQSMAEVNGTPRLLDSPPFLSSNRTFVPFRFVGEAFGAFVDYTVDESSGRTKEVIYELDKDRIIFHLLNQRMEKNGQLIADAPPVEIRNHRVMVPVRVLSENLGASVEWKASTQEIAVKKTW